MRIPDNCVMVIFGASGDLTHRKLIPALYNLAVDGLLPRNFAVVGFARKPKTNESFREEQLETVKEHSRTKLEDDGKWAQFACMLHYCQGDYSTPEDYEKLDAILSQIDTDHGTDGNRLFYIATPPEVYPTITEHIGTSAMGRPSGPGKWSRVIIEKPFGRDLKSARSLNEHVHKYFNEDQLYRIDHYLGKRRSRTSWSFASRTEYSSRSGTAGMLTACRSRWPRRLGSSRAAPTTRARA